MAGGFGERVNRLFGWPGYGFDMAIKMIKAFLREESGATAIEYGLIAAGISVAIIVAVNGIGTKLNTKFTSVSSQLK
jgi:pilus assembly protein Flp/PilA